MAVDPNEPLELRPFQVKELTRFQERKRHGISWDMGLGKTVGAATKAARARLRRWLVLCPDNALSVWGANPKFMGTTALDWIRREWPEVRFKVELIDGSPWNRDLQWGSPYETGEDPNLIHIRICVIDTFIRDWREEKLKEAVKPKKRTKNDIRFKPRRDYHIPEIVIYDEAKRIRNRDTMAFKILNAFLEYYNPQYFLPMTGTPGHEPRHFWTMLHLIDPRFFKSYWKFVHAFHMVDETPFGLEINEPKNLLAWHQVLSRYFSIVKEEDVEAERPPLTRLPLEITMDDDQRKLYNDLSEEMMSWVENDNHLVIAQNEFTVTTRLRQILICPKILSPSLSVGNAIKDFAETVEPGTHAVIFTPFTSAFEPFTTYLEHKGFGVQTLSGGIGTPERDARIQVYRDRGDVLICSILYAQAFSLEPATKCFFIGYDWDPDNNRQAEKRLHRLTTQNPITAYYYTYLSTLDAQIYNNVNVKYQRTRLTIPTLKELLSYGKQ